MIEHTTHFKLSLKRTTEGSPFQYMVVIPARVVPLAVQRHRLKRQASEAVRRIIQNAKARTGIRVIIHVTGNTFPGPTDLESELLSLIQKSGILNQ